jgi:hypothetical protein
MAKAELVLTKMRTGAVLQLTYGRFGPHWTLNGEQISDDVAKLVTGSSSVVGARDGLFDDAPAQTWRWWRG